MFCNKCGKPTGANDFFCKYCGNELELPNVSSSFQTTAFSENNSQSTEKKQKFNKDKCDICGSTVLSKIGSFDYMCEYCGSKFTVDEKNEIVDSKLTEAEILDVFLKAAEYENNGQHIEELQLFLEHRSQASDNPLYLNKLGRAYRHCEMYDKALEMYNIVLQLDPTFGSAYTNIGAVYICTGQYKLAEENLLKGLKLMKANSVRNTQNDFAVAHSNLALAVGYQNRTKEAKRYLEIAEKQYGYPNGARVRELIGIKKGLFR